MTKKEIVKHISERSKLTQLKTKEIVQWTFDAIVDTLIEEGRIELRNFGVFEVKRRKARKARNPRTGAKVEVEPKNVVTFQPGKEMEERVRLMAKVPERRRGALARRFGLSPGAAAGGVISGVRPIRDRGNARQGGRSCGVCYFSRALPQWGWPTPAVSSTSTPATRTSG